MTALRAAQRSRCLIITTIMSYCLAFIIMAKAEALQNQPFGDRIPSSSHLGLTGTDAQDGATAGVTPRDTHALHASPSLVAQSGRGLAQYPRSGSPSQVRAQVNAFVVAYNNATAHSCEWPTQVVCAGHLQVSTYTPMTCNHVLVYCLTNGFTTPSLRQNVFNCVSPHKRLAIFVTEPNEHVDRFEQLRHTLKDAAWDSLAPDLLNQRSTRFSHEALAGVTCR